MSRFDKLIRRRRPQQSQRLARRSMRLEPLENRNLLAITVDTLVDELDGSITDGDVSLRDAIAAAPAGETINFSVNGTIELTLGELAVNRDLTVRGPAGNRELRISGDGQSRVFSVDAGANVEIANVTIADGFADADAPVVPSSGGGILNLGNLSLRNVVMVGNESLGDPDVSVSDPSAVLDLGLVFKTAGGAAGGAVANFGTLEVTRGSFYHNSATAADDIDFVTQPGDPAFPFGAFPGNSFGGAISNFTTDYGTASVTVTRSHFVDNTAAAGDGGIGDFAAIAGGGAIGNDALLTVRHSTFVGNEAIGGDGATSPFHNGHALGGAISTGSLSPGVDPTMAGGSLAVSHSTFLHNEALGGSNNIVTLPLSQIPRADAPNNAYGGAVLAFQGNADLSHSRIRHNRAEAGVGGADENGSLAAGGGVFFFNFLGGVTGTVEHTAVSHNSAIGGDGPTGGDAVGGGIAAGSLGAPFGALGNVQIRHSVVASNTAIGGRGSDGVGGNGQGGGIANVEFSSVDVAYSRLARNEARGGSGTNGGGDGQGGGVYNIAGSSATLARSFVFANFATGGVGDNGSNGVGQGGGLFNEDGGQFELDRFTEFFTRFNHASDDGDDLFGTFTL